MESAAQLSDLPNVLLRRNLTVEQLWRHVRLVDSRCRGLASEVLCQEFRELVVGQRRGNTYC